MKKVLLFTLLLFFMSACSSQTDKKKASFVAVTSFPLFEISTKLLDGKVKVKKLIPYGREMHSFIPSPKTIVDISDAKLFIFNGLNMEPWLHNKYKNQMDMSEYITALDIHEDGHDHSHAHSKDPHYWLDISNMIKMTRAISTKLQELFPMYKAEILQNGLALEKEFLHVDLQYSKELKSCKKREIVLNHNAFGYLAHKYDFHSFSVTGLSPDEQVSAKKMKEIVDLVKKEDIKVIFFESFVSPKVSETISKETGAKTLALHSLANVTTSQAKQGYISLMMENLDNLSLAMECK